MKLYAASPELAELERCAAEGNCEGLVLLEASLGPSSAEGASSSLEAPSALGRPADAPGLVALGRLFAGPILVEVGSVDDATALAQLGPQFAARLSFAAAGVAAFQACRSARVRTNAFACATSDEAMEAGRAGAAWVSPALTGAAPGAPSAADFEGFRKTRGLLKALELDTELLVGPLRDAGAVLDATIMGAHVTLASPAVLREIAARRA